MSFQQKVVSWYLENKRDLPWRNTTDPYVIWLSEIILQQTRVEQGLPYFNKFLENFPTVAAFAAASEEQVLKLWQGLGYYSRGRNMLHTARLVMTDFSGIFPTEYASLIKLKGIGAYTAAAISSFSSNEEQAVVDGNVYRVLARFFGISEPINETKSQKQFFELANELIKGEVPSVYNQAIMEFGALQCKPKSPNCGVCPLSLECQALKQGLVGNLPVKLKKLKVKERWFNYFVAIKEGNILAKQRLAGDVWQHLYDFPLIETEATGDEQLESFAKKVQQRFGKTAKLTPMYTKKHVLTHQIIYVQFFALDNYIINFNQETEIKSVEINAFIKLPHPKIIVDFIENNIY